MNAARAGVAAHNRHWHCHKKYFCTVAVDVFVYMSVAVAVEVAVAPLVADVAARQLHGPQPKSHSQCHCKFPAVAAVAFRCLFFAMTAVAVRSQV